MNTLQLTRMQKTIIWTAGRLDLLKQAGLIEGPRQLTPDGMKQYHQLLVDSFRPLVHEVKVVLRDFDVPKKHRSDFLLMVMTFQKEREK